MTTRTKTKRAKSGTQGSEGGRSGPRVIRKYPNRRLYDTVETGFTVRGATRDYGLVRLEHACHAPPD